MTRILLIDDEPGMRQIIQRVLAPHGYVIAVAEDGGQAIEICRNEPVDLVLTDVRLPDMDAGEIMAGIRTVRPDLPLIVLSGFGDIDIAQGLVAQGAADYLTKPFKVNDLYHKVQNTLQRKTGGEPGTPAAAAEPAPAPAAPAERPTAPASAPPAVRPRKRVLIASAAVAAAAFIMLGVFIVGRSGNRGGETAYAVSLSNPSSMTWDGKRLWVADWVEGTVSQYAADAALTRVKEFTVPGIEPTGLAFQGNQLWISHGLDQKIYRCMAGTTLGVNARFESPGPSPSGLFFDGIYLWSLDLQQAKIFKHSPANLTVLSSYDSPAANPCSLFKNGKDFYIADAATNRIYRVDPEHFAIRGVYLIKGQENRKEHLSAAAFDGKNLWIAYDGVPKIYRCRIKDLKKIES